MSKKAKESTPTPCEDAQSKVLAMCDALFSGFSELVLEGKPYPFRLTVPEYLSCPNNSLWVFPVNRWCMPPHQLAERNTLTRAYWAYDYANGCLASLQEILPHYEKRKVAIYVFENAQNNMAAANAELRHRSRLVRAMAAHHAFFIKFLSNTGMNLQQALELPWNGLYEVAVERQKFRTIKWRAGGKPVFFEIQAVFFPVFKRYLQLRDYLLDGRNHEYLFLGFGLNDYSTPKQMAANIPSGFFICLQKIDPNLPKVMPRAWRAAKSDWAIRNTGLEIAAQLLQNSEQTVKNSYATGSDTKQQEEMTDFFEHIGSIVLDKGQLVADGVDLASGVCSAPGKPQPVVGTAAVTPDCKGPEGCLFCDKFKVHADEQDARKLLSCRFCLQQMSQLAASEEQYQMLFGSIFDRIQEILAEIDQRDAGMVERIGRQVEEMGELDAYWASKLEMLIELEMV